MVFITSKELINRVAVLYCFFTSFSKTASSPIIAPWDKELTFLPNYPIKKRKIKFNNQFFIDKYYKYTVKF